MKSSLILWMKCQIPPLHTHLLFLAAPALCWSPKQMFSLSASEEQARTFLAFHLLTIVSWGTLVAWPYPMVRLDGRREVARVQGLDVLGWWVER
jgi:hypothetical protein